MVCSVFAIICYRYNPRSEHIKWIILVLILGAMAGLSRAIVETIVPSLRSYNAEIPFVTQILIYIRIFTGFVSVHFYPWAVLMFAISYTGQLTKKAKTILAYILLVPIPFMFKSTVFFPDIKPDFQTLSYWAVPYLVISCVLLVLYYVREKDFDKKKERYTTIIIGLPVILSSLILNYIIRAFNDTHQYWRYMALFLGISFLIFLAKTLLDGVLGIRLIFERKTRENTMIAVTSGTALLNHTLKNEISKISISADNIQSSEFGKETEIQESLQTITNATNHIEAMITRIHGQMQDVILNVKEEDLTLIIEKALEAIKPFINDKQITITKIFHINPTIYCDAVHIQEVICNIIKNAIEAIKIQGRIKIVIGKTKNTIILVISDNGQGILKENLSYVLDPFFSTKKNKGQNFGLGLTYCYQVMQKHKGKFEIHSEEHEGATVTLQFPSIKEKMDTLV
jgi:two-component system sporulation sensor kinase B